MVLVSHLGLSLHYLHYVRVLANCYGKVGLRVCYVLAGFLITQVLLRERTTRGSISVKSFYTRRAYRILPAAYVYMSVYDRGYCSVLQGVSNKRHPAGIYLFVIIFYMILHIFRITCRTSGRCRWKSSFTFFGRP